MKHDYLKSVDSNIFVVNAEIDIKNKRLMCGYLDIELEPAEKETELVSETGASYFIDTDFSGGEVEYPCNQFNVRIILSRASTS